MKLEKSFEKMWKECRKKKQKVAKTYASGGKLSAACWGPKGKGCLLSKVLTEF